MNDLNIRGATVVDGLGNEPVQADGAVKDDRVVAIGDVRDDATRTKGYASLDKGPGKVLDSFNRSSGASAV